MARCAQCGSLLPGVESLCRNCYATKRVDLELGLSGADHFRRELMMAPVTIAIFLINYLVHFLIIYYTALHANTNQTTPLIRLGANYGPLVRDGEWWRLVTSMFMHAGGYHLLFNMACLLSLGPLVERMLGRVIFCLTYLLTGICASLMSVVFHPNTPSLGASGAIFGLAGILIAYRILWRASSGVFRISASFVGLTVFIAANLVLGAVIPFVDNAGHAGGLLSGLVIGFLVWVFTPRRRLASATGE